MIGTKGPEIVDVCQGLAGNEMIVGTHPLVAYYRTQGEAERDYFADFFAFTGKTQHARADSAAVQVRVQQGAGRTFVWILNPTREIAKGTIWFGDGIGTAVAGHNWVNDGASFDGTHFTVPPRDALVAELS